jgi:hypothetical protein
LTARSFADKQWFGYCDLDTSLLCAQSHCDTHCRSRRGTTKGSTTRNPSCTSHDDLVLIAHDLIVQHTRRPPAHELFVEKGGYRDILEEAGLLRRLNMGIMSTQGFGTRAGKEVVRALRRLGVEV